MLGNIPGFIDDVSGPVFILSFMHMLYSCGYKSQIALPYRMLHILLVSNIVEGDGKHKAQHTNVAVVLIQLHFT